MKKLTRDRVVPILAHLLRRHPDAGVGHRDRDPVAAIVLSLQRIDSDGAVVGELVGVALFEFLAASGSMVLTTSAISGATANDERASSIRPASILDRSRMSLIKASRWRPAPST